MPLGALYLYELEDEPRALQAFRRALLLEQNPQEREKLEGLVRELGGQGAGPERNPMPKIALSALLHDWERLVEAAELRVEELPDLAPDVAALRADLERARELEIERTQLQAQRQAATQELNRIKEHGTDQARDLRNRARALLGGRNPLLKAFNVRALPPKLPRR